MDDEDASGIAIEQSLAGAQPLCNHFNKGCTTEVEISDLSSLPLGLLQVGVFLFEFRVVDGYLLGDFGIETGTAPGIRDIDRRGPA
ncbi:MAG: hypothetical protein J0H84_02740 [Rhizobiales bacterium]|nr:hypothetical protein [Hyphomicrobiales bacterium]